MKQPFRSVQHDLLGHGQIAAVLCLTEFIQNAERGRMRDQSLETAFGNVDLADKPLPVFFLKLDKDLVQVGIVLQRAFFAAVRGEHEDPLPRFQDQRALLVEQYDHFRQGVQFTHGVVDGKLQHKVIYRSLIGGFPGNQKIQLAQVLHQKQRDAVTGADLL